VIERTHEKAFGVGEGAQLAAFLQAPAAEGTVVLFGCQYPQIHNFVIEVQRATSASAQGYQGTFSLNWWLGLEKEDEAQFLSSAQEDTEFGRMRKQWGLGEEISPSFELSSRASVPHFR
jgi:hypothetical protein